MRNMAVKRPGMWAVAVGVVWLAVPGLAAAQTFNEGVDFNGTSRGQSGFIPPDSMGSVGPNHYVEMINGRYRVYSKTGAQLEDRSLNSFWNTYGQGFNGSFSFDPRVVYDPHAQRFYAHSVDNAGGANNLLFAVSDSDNPLDGWTGWKVDSDTDNAHWADFGQMGFNKDAVVITANMFLISGQSGDGFENNMLILPKADLLGGTPSIANRTLLENQDANVSFDSSLQLAVDHDGTRADLLSFSGSNSFIGINRFTGLTGTPSVSHVKDLSVNFYGSPPLGRQPAPFSGTDLDSGGTRIRSRVTLINDEYWGVHIVSGTDGSAAVRWFRIDADTQTLIEEGLIEELDGGDADSLGDRDYIYAAIAANADGQVVIAMTGTGPNDFPSSYAVVGEVNPGTNTTAFGTPKLLHAGSATYEVVSGTRNRWGDYSATDFDPADPGIFWTIQEYAPSTNQWRMRITEIIPTRAGEVRWEDDSSGSFSAGGNWFDGGAPGASDHVIFSRVGNAYTVSFAANATSDRASVRQGTTTLDLNGHTYLLTSTAAGAPSLAISEYQGDASLTVTDGQLSTEDVWIGVGVNGDGSLAVDGGTTTWTNAGDVYVGGSDTEGTGGSGALALTNGAAATVGGTLRVWANGGATLDSGATLAVGTIHDTDGGAFNHLGGTLSFGTYTGDYHQQGGTHAPGSSPGIATVTGGYTMTSGTLVLDLDGTTPGSGHDQVNAGGAVSLGGTLDIDLGFAAASQDSFVILTGSSVGGAFAAVTGDRVDGFIPFVVDVNPTDVTLIVATPGDATLDNKIDFSDFLVLQSNFQSAGVFEGGDFNGSGVVDFSDFLILQANFGFNAALAPAVLDRQLAGLAAFQTAYLESVPEPATLAVVGLGLVALCRRSHDRGRSRSFVARPQTR